MLSGVAADTRRLLAGALVAAGSIFVAAGGTTAIARADQSTGQTVTIVVPDHTVPSTPTTPTTAEPSTSTSGLGPGGPGGPGGAGGGDDEVAVPERGDLPRTGFDPSLIVVGVLLVLSGIVLRGIARLADSD
jgi:hypothetical protein